MQKVLTAAEMREVDRQTTEKYGIPSILLMENAAHAAARIISNKLGGSVVGKSFLILCGKGNNGGDGAALARILWTQGANVDVYLFGKVEETKGDARTNFEILKKVNFDELLKDRNWFDKAWEESNLLFNEEADPEWWKRKITPIYKVNVVVDAIFGTGLTRPIEDPLKKIIEGNWFEETDYRDSSFLTVALDIPSGLNSDKCEQIGDNTMVDLTITFTAPKPANVLPPASNFNGEVVVVNIGSPQELIDDLPSQLFVAEKQDASIWLERTKFTSGSYKNKRGHALLIVGSREYSGAAVLAGNAAMLSGVGLTTIATGKSAQAAISAKILEEIITRALPETEAGAIADQAFTEIRKLAEKADVIGIGCGLGPTGGNATVSERAESSRTARDVTENKSVESAEGTSNFVREVVEQRRSPVVIDADGLNALSPFNLKGSDVLPLILTPHEGEFLRLLGTKDRDVLKDRVKAVRDFAEKHQVILVLKGERALIGAPDGRVVINPTGNSGLGKAGNGDTLMGVITGFVAQAVQMRVDIFETVVAAVYIAGLAGDIAEAKLGKRRMLASDVRESLGQAFEELGTPST